MHAMHAFREGWMVACIPEETHPRPQRSSPYTTIYAAIQMAMGILQWMTVADDFKDDRGSDIPVGMIEGMLSARIIAGP
jgi:hypothetical protein